MYNNITFKNTDFAKHYYSSIVPLIEEVTQLLEKNPSADVTDKIAGIIKNNQSLIQIYGLGREDKLALGKVQNHIVNLMPVKSSFVIGGLVGLRNPSGTNRCAINTLIQLVMGSPRLLEKALASPLLKPIFVACLNAEQEGLDVADLDTDQLKMLLGFKKNRQIDIAEALTKFFEIIGLKNDVVTAHRNENHQIIFTERPDSADPLICFGIQHNARNSLVESLKRHFFESQIALKIAPRDLVLQADRSSYTTSSNSNALLDIFRKPTVMANSIKLTDPIEVAGNFELPEELVENGEKAQYELVHCGIQLGRDNEGHYVALEKKSDGWYLIDDDKITKKTDLEAQKLLEQGTIFHYQKVESSQYYDWAAWALKGAASMAYTIARYALQLSAYPFKTLFSDRSSKKIE